MKNVLDVNVRGRHVYYKVRVTKTAEVARNGKSRQAVITQLVLRFEYVTCLYLITTAFRPFENSSLARNIKNILKNDRIKRRNKFALPPKFPRKDRKSVKRVNKTALLFTSAVL